MIRVGIGGWVFEPWRGTFYPADLPQKRELEYAAARLSSIEVNGTFYGSQKPASFRKWREEAPDGFVFALKGPRYATNRRVLAEGATSVQRFLDSGIVELGEGLGPINWQLPETKAFDPDDIAAFLKLLPDRHEGRRLRHAVEARHDSFRDPRFAELLRARNVAAVIAGDAEYPQIADITADFVYVRIMGTAESHPLGYGPQALDRWAARARTWAEGGTPDDLPLVGTPPERRPREVFLYVISGFKPRNPQAAMALIERLGQGG